jgi:uncharacterized protein (DUF934 family)
MALVRGTTVVDDPWRMIREDEALPADEPAIVGKARYLAERDALVGRNAPLGLLIEAGEGLAGLNDADIARFALIALSFPKYTDGRAYSVARILRENHGFKGELRAVGNVLRDQIEFMHRCGFSSFEIEHEGTLKALVGGTIKTVDIHYQPAGREGRETVPDGTRPWLRATPVG